MARTIGHFVQSGSRPRRQWCRGGSDRRLHAGAHQKSSKEGAQQSSTLQKCSMLQLRGYKCREWYLCMKWSSCTAVTMLKHRSEISHMQSRFAARPNTSNARHIWSLQLPPSPGSSPQGAPSSGHARHPRAVHVSHLVAPESSFVQRKSRGHPRARCTPLGFVVKPIAVRRHTAVVVAVDSEADHG